MIPDAVVLVGGKGTRLQSVVQDRPKPMALVGGKPFLAWLLLALSAQGVRRVILCTGYMAEKVQEYFGSHFAQLKIYYSHENVPLGTAGAIRKAVEQVESPTFLALNGDSYCRIALSQLLAKHQLENASVTLQLMAVEDCRRYGSVSVDEEQSILAFNEKRNELRPGLINAGVYLLQRDLFAQLPLGVNISIEKDFFPEMIGKGIYGVVGDGPFIDIGTPESYSQTATVLEKELIMLNQLASRSQTFSDEQLLQRVEDHLQQSANVMRLVAERLKPEIFQAAQLLADQFRAGNKLLLCGNGGSAADCQHMAAEFVSRLTKDFARPALPAIALTTDSSFLTAYANDLDFAGVFERQVQALGQAGDILIGISTSGNSENVIKAVEAAHVCGMKTIVLIGEGGKLGDLATCPLVIPSRNTQYIQEASLAIEHILCDLCERMLYA